MKLTALNNFVVLRLQGELDEKRTASGLYLPEKDTPDPATAIIESIGSYARIKAKVGDKVLFPPYGIGEWVALEGVTYFILLDHELLGVCHEDNGQGHNDPAAPAADEAAASG